MRSKLEAPFLAKIVFREAYNGGTRAFVVAGLSRHFIKARTHQDGEKSNVKQVFRAIGRDQESYGEQDSQFKTQIHLRFRGL